MPSAPEFLTTREIAALLRVKERKVYDLAAAGEIPCSRVTGKLLFPRVEIEAWLTRHQVGAGGRSITAKPLPNVLVGSHDPLLEWALRESRSGIPAFLDGSLDGLDRLSRGEAIAGGMHLWEPAAGDWNRDHVAQALSHEPVVLLEWAWRERGLIVAAGNPLQVGALRDLRGRRFMPRQREAGSQVLLDALLEEQSLAPGDLDQIEPPARSESDVAVAVADGKADAGIGLGCMARQFRLGFVPLVRERFDLVVWRRAYFDEPFQRLLAFCRSEAFRARAAELGGYDISGLGEVRYNAP